MADMTRGEREWVKDLREGSKPLLSAAHIARIEAVLLDECRLKKQDVEEIIDTLNGCANDPFSSTTGVVTEAMSGLIKNERFMQTVIKSLVTIVEAAIKESKAPAPKPSSPAPAQAQTAKPPQPR